MFVFQIIIMIIMFMLNWIVSVVIYFGTWIENNEVVASKGCSGLGPNKW